MYIHQEQHRQGTDRQRATAGDGDDNDGNVNTTKLFILFSSDLGLNTVGRGAKIQKVCMARVYHARMTPAGTVKGTPLPRSGLQQYFKRANQANGNGNMQVIHSLGWVLASTGLVFGSERVPMSFANSVA